MDLSPMWEQLQGMLDYVLILIPNLVIGLIVFGLFFLAARGLRGLALRFSEERRRHRNLGLVLGLIALGLFGYLVWRLTEAFADIEGEGDDPKGLTKRAGHAVNGLVYGGIGLQAGLLALGRSSGGGGSSQQEWTARFMSLPFGRWLVGLAGLLVIGYGLYQLYEAWKEKYRERLMYGQMSAAERRWVDPLSKAGLVAHGIVLGLVGAFLIQAAYRFNPQEAQGLGGALTEIARQPFGPWLLGITALGLIAYGIYKLAQARYHRVLAR